MLCRVSKRRLSDASRQLPPHYVTLSKATLEAAAAANANYSVSRHASLFEQVNFNGPFSGLSHQAGLMGPPSSLAYPVPKDPSKFGSQPSDINKLALGQFDKVPKSSTFSATKWLLESAQTPRPHSLPKNSSIDDDDYLFPDLPPPPNAKLDTPLPILKHPPPLAAKFGPMRPSFEFSSDNNDNVQNSRSSSLDDLTSQDYYLPLQYIRSNTLPNSSGAQIKQTTVGAPTPLNKGAQNGIFPELTSSAETSMKRPGSAPDLNKKASPIRSALRSTMDRGRRSRGSRKSLEARAGLGGGSNKKVMFRCGH